MSNEKTEGGLIWSPLFNVTSKEIESFINALETYSNEFSLENFVELALGYEHHKREDKDLLQATKIAIFKLVLMHPTFAQDVLSEEDYKKAQSTYKRGQFNSGALKNLLNCFLKAYQFFYQYNKSVELYLLLWCEIQNQYELIKSAQVEKAFGPLKKVVEDVASGVKADCFLDATRPSLDIYSLDKSLNEYLINKYGYDFNNANYGTKASFGGKEKNKLLQLAIYNDKDFWKDKSFFVVGFINSVLDRNSEKHAEKILDYIFSRLTSHPLTKALMDEGLSLSLYDSQAYIDFFSMQFKKLGYSLDLLYPLTSVEGLEEKCKRGEEVFNSFLYSYVYPNNKDEIKRMLREDLHKKSTKKSLSVFEAISFCTLRMNIWGDYNKALRYVCPDFFLEESFWKRVYLKAYEASLYLEKAGLNACLFESFHEAFLTIEEISGIETSAQRDTYARDRSFDKLKAILSDFGVTISESNKADYINALLDKTVASSLETERFPVLEQLGDAIYGFAVAEMIFYNPVYINSEESTVSLERRFEEYTCAIGQLKVARNIGTSELYLSPFNIFATRDNELDYAQEKKDEEQKYLADSLEMILGAVSLDLGYNVAISLAKAMIKKAYEGDFEEELRFSYENVTREDIDRDYWRRILPGLYSYKVYDNSYLHLMYDAFFKLIGCLVLKTEAKNERRFITFGSCGLSQIFNRDNDLAGMVCPVFHCYLNNGLDKVIELYKDSALEAYNKLDK